MTPELPEPRGITRTGVDIQTPQGQVPAFLYRPDGPRASDRGFVWVHGGGFAAGSLEMPEADWASTQWASMGIPVLSLDYRKAVHGVHFPAPSDDVLAGWRWAVASASLGVGPTELYLGGASAGASLALGVAKRLRNSGAPTPRGLVLAYPLVHPQLPIKGDTWLAAIRRQAGDLYFSPERTAATNANYAGTEQNLQNEYAFPGLGKLTDLPPALVLNCEYDTIRASGELLVEDLAAAGNAVTSQMSMRSRHGPLNRPGTPDGVWFVERIASWLLGGWE